MIKYTKKMKKIFLLISIFTVFLLVSCSGSSSKKLTVKFDTQGGNKIADVLVLKLEKINLPTPQKENNTFDGWYTNTSYTGDKLPSEYIVLVI